MKNYVNAFKFFYDYKTKSDLNEFWSFYVITFLLSIISGITASITGIKDLKLFFLGIHLLPSISLGFRRLNDAGINRWLFLIPIVNLILASMPSKNQDVGNF